MAYNFLASALLARLLLPYLSRGAETTQQPGHCPVTRTLRPNGSSRTGQRRSLDVVRQPVSQSPGGFGWSIVRNVAETEVGHSGG